MRRRSRALNAFPLNELELFTTVRCGFAAAHGGKPSAFLGELYYSLRLRLKRRRSLRIVFNISR